MERNTLNISGLLKKITPDKTFMVLAFIFGILFSFIIPPFQSPDEPAHFFRAYQLSGLKIIGVKTENNSGGYIPKQIVEMTDNLTGNIPSHTSSVKTAEKCDFPQFLTFARSTTASLKNELFKDVPWSPKKNKVSVDKIAKYINMKLDLKDSEFTNFKNTVLYPPTVYLPQSLGIAASRAFELSPLSMVYLGRILNLLAFILITYSAIKIIPVCKWGMVLLSLMPMTLALASSLAADATCFSLSFLTIALILNYALTEEKKISGSQVFVLSLLAFLLGMCKLAYIFIPFLFLIIPITKFSSKNKYFVSFFTVIFCTLSGAILWALLVQNLYNPILAYLNPYEQLHYTLGHPQYFIQGFLGSFTNLFTYHSFVGNLGWLDNSLPTWLVAVYFGVLTFCGLVDSDEKISINFAQKIIVTIVLFLSIFLIDFMMYLFWNKVGATFIEGLQGRYFIPVAPLFLISIYNKKYSNLNIINNGGKIFLAFFSIFTLIFTFWIIINRYYI